MTMTTVWPSDLRGQLEDLWERGLPSGDKTGWPSVDQHYTVVPGQLTILTGWPSSGKSEWLDALLVNLSHQGWRIAIFSPENQPIVLHLAKFVEKLAGMPFGEGPSARIPKQDLGAMLDEMAHKFLFIQSPEGGALSVAGVIDAAEMWLMKPGVKRGLVIDPWNELEHLRPPGFSETEYVSQTLSYIRNWARAASVHVWLVAHPKNMPRDKNSGKLPIPKPDMISGSQHWWNKADCCVTIWRDLAEGGEDVEIHVQKVRFKHVGRIGMATLKYDRVTGRYTEAERNIYAVRG